MTRRAWIVIFLLMILLGLQQYQISQIQALQNRLLEEGNVEVDRSDVPDTPPAQIEQKDDRVHSIGWEAGVDQI
jgi:hypothetical protein